MAVILYDVSLADCQTIAQVLGIRFEGTDKSNSRGERASGVLRANSATNPYPRVSASWARNKDGTRRKMGHCVCWHGHRDFMFAVFEHNPDARIVTGLRGAVDYRGKEDFLAKYPDTAWFNIGARIEPVALCQACSCKESGEDN